MATGVVRFRDCCQEGLPAGVCSHPSTGVSRTACQECTLDSDSDEQNMLPWQMMTAHQVSCSKELEHIPEANMLMLMTKLMASARIDIQQYKHRYSHRDYPSSAGQKHLHVHNKSLTSCPTSVVMKYGLSQPSMPMH